MLTRVSKSNPQNYLAFFQGHSYDICLIDRASGELHGIEDIPKFLADYKSLTRIEGLGLHPPRVESRKAGKSRQLKELEDYRATQISLEHVSTRHKFCHCSLLKGMFSGESDVPFRRENTPQAGATLPSVTRLPPAVRERTNPRL